MRAIWGRRFAATLLALGMGANTAQAAEKVKAAIGQLGLWDTLITVFAVENGYYKELGLDVEYVKTQGGGETAQMIITGGADFGMTIGILSGIASYAKGAPVRIVSSEIVGTPDTFWYVRSDSALKTVNEINGRSVAFSRTGSGTHLTLLALTSHLKLEPKLVSTGGLPATRTQVMTNQVEVGWSVPPFNLDLIRKGEARILFKGDIVAPLADVSIRVNIANSNWLAKNRETAKKFMMGYHRALEWMYGAGKDEATQRFAKMNNLDIEVARDAVGFYKKEHNALAPIQNLDKAVALAVQHNMIKEPLTVAQKNELVDIVYEPSAK